MQIQNNTINFKQRYTTILKDGSQVLLDINKNNQNKISSIQCLITKGDCLEAGIGVRSKELSQDSIQAIKSKLQNSLKEISSFFENHIK